MNIPFIRCQTLKNTRSWKMPKRVQGTLPWIARGDCPRRDQWSDACPRCQEVPGAGVCPAPGSFVEFALLFNRTYVLCYGTGTCPRHRRGYWPLRLHERMSVFDGRDLDRALATRLGPRGAALLGLLDSPADVKRVKVEFGWLRIVRHRILALLATLKVIELAHGAGLPNVLFLEGDVRPVPRNMLSSVDIRGLDGYLRSNPWQVVRPGGYYYDYSQYRFKRSVRNGCAQRCRCLPTGLTRACLVRSAGDLESRCDVRDTVAFAAHSRTFPAFQRARRVALETIVATAEALIPSGEVGSSSHRADLKPTSPASRRLTTALFASLAHARLNASFGRAPETFNDLVPWFDKWLPFRFDVLYLLPSLVVQQIRQGDEHASRLFMQHCMSTQE